MTPKHQKRQLEEKIRIRKERIDDKNRLIEVWKRSPEQMKHKLNKAREEVKNLYLEIQELDQELDIIKKQELKSDPAQIDLFQDPPPMMERALDQAPAPDVLLPNEFHNPAMTKEHLPDRAHNMMNTPEPEVEEKRAKNKSQNEQIHEVFLKYPDRWMTPWDVNRILKWPEKRITSTRRGITDLKRDKILEKSDETRREQEGTVNALYKLIKP